MSEHSKIKSKWTIEICKQEALKYSYRSSFQKNSPAYKAAYKYGWLDEICRHMVKPKPYNYKWTFEECEKEAKKYSLKKDFQSKSSSAYGAALKNNWLKLIQENFSKIKKPNGYWTYELCEIEAKKHKNKRLFRLNSSAAYDASYRNKWLDFFYPCSNKSTNFK